MRRRVLVPVALLWAVACAGPAPPAATSAPTGPDVAPSTPARAACPEVVATHTGVASRMKDRELVPLSKSLFGVESMYGTDQRGFMLVSGGYLDDVLEAYDDLDKTGEAKVRGVSADVLVGTFVEPEDTRVAIWREPVDAPCDAHALVAWNLTGRQFTRVLKGLR